MSKWKEGIKKGFLDNSTEVWASLMAQTITDLPAMQETWVLSLGQEDSLKEGMASHSSIVAWRIPMDRGAWQAASPWGHKELDRTEVISTAQALRVGVKVHLSWSLWPRAWWGDHS